MGTSRRSGNLKAGLSRREFLQALALLGKGAVLSSLAGPLLTLQAGCSREAPDYAERESATLRRLVLLYTNDEHGWMEPSGEVGGAAGMLGLWRKQEQYDPAGPYLALSGGDSWIGPAISTWFGGESMMDIMGEMGYAAAALGNHDFDFGLDVLRRRGRWVQQGQAPYPLLAANVRRRSDGASPDFLRAYTIREVNGIRVGLIGLATLETPWDTQPEYAADFDFIAYDQALREVVPQVKGEGAALLVVVGHICSGEMRRLAPAAAELGISILCGGHCHEETVETVEGVAIVQSGSFLRNYVRIALLFDTANGRVVEMHAGLQPNRGGQPAADLAARVDDWRQKMPAELFAAIGYLGTKIDRDTAQMAHLMTRPWLAAYPQARAALYSGRYIQSLPPGEISRAGLLGMLPTDNALVDVGLTGAQLVETIEKRQAVFGGLQEQGDGYCLEDGSPLEPQALYRVLIPQALYEGGDAYAVKQYDPAGLSTGLNWRDPIAEWIAALKTSPSDPLEKHL